MDCRRGCSGFGKCDRRRWNKTETTSARDGVEEPSREPKITSRKKLYLRTTGTTGTVAAGRSHPTKTGCDVLPW